MPFQITIPTQYFRAQMKLHLSRQMLFKLWFYWHGIQKQNWKQKAHKTYPPKSVILKSQHNILDSARTTMDSSKAIHFRFLLSLQCEEVNRYWLKMAFPMVHIDNKLRGWQKAKKQKWPGKYPELNTNTYSLKRGWRVSMGEKGLQRHWSECELTTPITGLVQGRNWSQDRDLSGAKETSNSL